jgi:hypothetical protein
MLPGSLKERAERALPDSEAVFSGEVVDFEKSPLPTTMMEETMVTMVVSPRPATVTLRVSEAWKGPRQQAVRLTRDVADGISCGYPFQEGQEYLVYAYRGQQGLVSDGCTETKRLSEANADLTALGDGERPQDGEVLSETSGRFSGPALLGLAGLALAASLLVAMRLTRTS